MAGIDAQRLVAQEETFARAFGARDLEIARPLYHPEVVYVSPTVRLFGWPAPIVGVERTLEFIALTIARCERIAYAVAESSILDGGRSAFVRIHFDWSTPSGRLRSNYVVLYRYRAGLIGRQELYYDPSGALEALA